jgi:hypothetical protein
MLLDTDQSWIWKGVNSLHMEGKVERMLDEGEFLRELETCI